MYLAKSKDLVLMDTQGGILYGSDRFLRMLLQVSFISFTDRAIVYGFSLRTWNTVYSFVCFDHCAERCLCPYHRLFSGFEPAR
jgi:hypothetical protein